MKPKQGYSEWFVFSKSNPFVVLLSNETNPPLTRKQRKKILDAKSNNHKRTVGVSDLHANSRQQKHSNQGLRDPDMETT
jgi:hypothetical protein